MPPKIPPSASPTELLWAHQIRREHGLLLQRMQKLEVTFGNIDSSASNRIESDIAAIQEQVNALPKKNDINDAIKHVRDDLTGQVGTVTANVDAISNKLSEMIRMHRNELAEKERAAENREAELLQRVKNLEATVKQSREIIEGLRTRLNNTWIEKVNEQLASLARGVQDESDDLQTVGKAVELLAVKCKELENVDQQMAKSVNGVEQRLEVLKSWNGKLEQRLELVKKRAEDAAKSAIAADALTATMERPHIIQNNQAAVTDLARSVSAATKVVPPKPRSRPQTKAQTTRSARKAMPASPAETVGAPTAAANDESSVANSRQKKDVRDTTATSLQTLSRRRIDSATQKPVVKSGKGYIVVEEKIENDEEKEEEEQLAEFLSKINTGPNPTRGRAPMQDESAQESNDLQRRHSSSSRTPAMVRTASIVQSVEVPNVPNPRPKRRTIDQNPIAHNPVSKTSNDNLFARFATQKSRKPHDTIDPSIDVNAPRATRSRKVKAPAAPTQPALKVEMNSPKKRVVVKKEPKTSPQKRKVADQPVVASQRPLKKRRTIPQD